MTFNAIEMQNIFVKPPMRFSIKKILLNDGGSLCVSISVILPCA